MTHPQGKLFLPHRAPGGLIMLGLTGLFWALAVGAAAALPGRAVSGETFWLGVGAGAGFALGAVCLYRALAHFKLRYFINRNGLKIYWGAATRTIPMQSITAVVPAQDASLPRRRLLAVTLPAWWVGRWKGTEFYAAAPPERALVVKTTPGDVVISPADAPAFVRAWQLRVPLGPTQPWMPGVVRRSIWGHPLWQDRSARRMGAGAILLSLILTGATMTAYPAWPAAIPIQFDALRQAVTIARKAQLLWIPVGGGLILLFNLSLGFVWYKKERLATVLLWFVAMLAQIGLWAGIRMVVG
ncbi:MAG: PH domain-containing protein [Anaerolineae bacterium]